MESSSPSPPRANCRWLGYCLVEQVESSFFCKDLARSIERLQDHPLIFGQLHFVYLVGSLAPQKLSNAWNDHGPLPPHAPGTPGASSRRRCQLQKAVSVVQDNFIKNLATGNAFPSLEDRLIAIESLRDDGPAAPVAFHGYPSLGRSPVVVIWIATSAV